MDTIEAVRISRRSLNNKADWLRFIAAVKEMEVSEISEVISAINEDNNWTECLGPGMMLYAAQHMTHAFVKQMPNRSQQVNLGLFVRYFRVAKMAAAGADIAFEEEVSKREEGDDLLGQLYHLWALAKAMREDLYMWDLYLPFAEGEI